MKKKVILISSISAAIAIIAITLIIVLCIPKGSKSYRSIKVFAIDGSATVNRDNNDLEAKKDMKLKNEDVVKTIASSTVTLKLDDDKFILVKEDTTIRLKATGSKKNTKTRILVDNGGVVVEVKEKLKDNEAFEIATSNSIMAIRGTDIGCDVENNGTELIVNFRVIFGNTDLFLYKEGTLNKTTLNKDEKLVYKTSLSNTTTLEKIEELTDKKESVDINDGELESKFNTKKEELTSKEIDEIIDSINTFEKDEDEMKNGVIKLNFTSNPGYSVDPSTLITLDKEYSGLTYLYSKTIDGTFTEFDLANPLEMGEWYCKVISTDAYRSDPIKFNVVAKDINLDIEYSTVNHGHGGFVEAKLSNLDEFFNSPLAQTLADDNTSSSKYKYYVYVYIQDPSDPYYGWNFFLDYDNKDVICYTEFANEAEIELTIDYCLPAEFNVLNPSEVKVEFEEKLDVNYVYAKLDEGSDTLIYAYIDYYATNGDQRLALFYTTDGENYVELEPSYDTDTGICNVTFINTTCSFYYALTNTDIRSVEYSFDRSNFADVSTSHIESGTPGNGFFTYNLDNTVNLYYDINYSSADNTLNNMVVYKYTDSFTNKARYMFVRGDKKYSYVEDIKERNYSINNVSIIKEVNGLIYECYDVESPSGEITGISDYGFMNAADDAYYAESYDLFVKGSKISIYGDGFTYLLDVTDSDFENDYKFNKSLLDYDGENCYFSGTVYGYLNNDISGGFGNDSNAFTDDAFAYISEQLSNSGITIKGSNKHYLELNVL